MKVLITGASSKLGGEIALCFALAGAKLALSYKSGAKKTDTFISQPPKRPLLMLGLRREKEDTNMKINARIKEMLK